ncbi:hypothetical protein HN446_02180 [bacterium]|jgi:hypothetical protein|nr:hypothetical protein [bacterium]
MIRRLKPLSFLLVLIQALACYASEGPYALGSYIDIEGQVGLAPLRDNLLYYIGENIGLTFPEVCDGDVPMLCVRLYDISDNKAWLLVEDADDKRKFFILSIDSLVSRAWVGLPQ